MLDFAPEVLVPYLDLAHAREFLAAPQAPDETPPLWEQETLTVEHVTAALRAYAAFGWGKIQDHRGISANRTIDKCCAWVWLLGDDATLSAVEAAGYAQYGAPKLAVICKAFDLPIPSDKGVQRMILGEPCHDFCNEGCD